MSNARGSAVPTVLKLGIPKLEADSVALSAAAIRQGVRPTQPYYVVLLNVGNEKFQQHCFDSSRTPNDCMAKKF